MRKLDLFAHQFARLRIRFGEKALDDEFMSLALREIEELSPEAFTRACDVWIGSRKHTDPPRMAEFREAAAAFNKRNLENTMRGALHAFETRAMPEILARHGYPGCKTLYEAVQVERHRMRIRQADAGGEGA